MNEEKNLQEMFQRIEIEVSASEGLRRGVQAHLAAKRKPRFVRRWQLASGFLAVAAVVAGSLMVVPMSSAAAILRKMDDAIKDVKFMHVRSYSQRGSDPRHLFGEMFYSQGSWRSEAFPGTPLARTYIRSKGEQWLYLACSDVSVGEPQMKGPIEGTPTALELAKAMTDEGEISGPRDFKIEARPDEGGKQVYAIVGTRPGTDYHMVMLVDKKTNLPMRATFAGAAPVNEGEQFSEEYTYEDHLELQMFDPKVKPTTKVFDLPIEVSRLKEAWKKPIQSVTLAERHMEIRDVSTNSRGEIFMVCSFGGGSDKNPAEAYQSALLPASMKDDLGRSYELVFALNPGATFGDTTAKDDLLLSGDRVKILAWEPVKPTPGWQPAKSIEVTCRSGSQASPEATAKVLAPAPMATRFPAYHDSLLFGYEDLQFDMMASDIRASEMKKEHDYLGAARWYRDAALHAPMPGWKRKFEASATQCLKLGSPSKAP